jgi:(1->4)-alpha-D-glucan 1-alpha-D-glucosylmutase
VAAAPDRAALAHELVKTRADARVKLFVIHEGLRVRRARRALFEAGAYVPLESRGAWAEHACAFGRVDGEAAVLTVFPRLLARRGIDALPLGPEYWADTRLALPPGLAGRYASVFTGERVETTGGPEAPVLPVGAVLASFPVALLERVAP